jgi:hypothetical protein
MGLWEAVWGKMSVLTVGSFQVFIKNVTLTYALHVKVHLFQNPLIFMCSVEAIYFSLEHIYVRLVFAQNTQYNPSSFFLTNISRTCSWILIDVHTFS